MMTAVSLVNIHYLIYTNIIEKNFFPCDENSGFALLMGIKKKISHPHNSVFFLVLPQSQVHNNVYKAQCAYPRRADGLRTVM